MSVDIDDQLIYITYLQFEKATCIYSTRPNSKHKVNKHGLDSADLLVPISWFL